MKFPHGKLSLPIVLVLALLLAGCGRGKQEATPTPTKTPAVEQVVEVATATPAAPAEAVEAAPPAAEEQPAQRNNLRQSRSPQLSQSLTWPRSPRPQLNIRSEPSTTADIVRLVDQGAQFEVVGYSDDGQWIQVAENGQPLGWIVAEFASVEAGAVAVGGSDSGETASC